eukprot:TRINITY_DN21883_c0_g2_i1.p1 TRINITY_DN21883_c0_g2~~TRINITY_DN21883_c0_g2_i1.p1  ORF type:complete len:183 (+),score=44.90 TRINITY_DN21883_c0_g2_i1:579-1127(+)
MKTVERAHSPRNLWEKVRLAGQLRKALDQVEKLIGNWPTNQLKRVKEELVKRLQQQEPATQMAQKGLSNGTKLSGISRKLERREAKREVKAENSARLSQSVEQELLQRLRQGMYGGLHQKAAQTSLVPEMEVVKVNVDELRELHLDDFEEPCQPLMKKQKLLKQKKQKSEQELEIEHEMEFA